MTELLAVLSLFALVFAAVCFVDNERRRRRLLRECRPWLRIVRPASGDWETR